MANMAAAWAWNQEPPRLFPYSHHSARNQPNERTGLAFRDWLVCKDLVQRKKEKKKGSGEVTAKERVRDYTITDDDLKVLLGLVTVKGEFRLASNIVKEAFAGLVRRQVRARMSGGFAKEDDSYKEESGGEEERPKVGQNGEERRCKNDKGRKGKGKNECYDYGVLELEDLF
ncbi:hypothetical protein CCACVL1_11241 [Corchorus capsularis]|uniref:Uncharacterized protein n=1 Tax=Corchorus capsularis TaxID=210143 RepID=A0A1R3IME5_COCAP|nr:hypothetical protein CCACVL1_11241 [Corchorus capsularis]